MLEPVDTVPSANQTNDMIVNGIKYVILLGYIICTILLVNYGFQSNIAAADLVDILEKCQGYDEEYATNLKQKTQGFVTTIAIYVFIIIILSAACLFLYFTENKVMVRRVVFTVTIVIMIVFTITFLGLVGAANKNLDNLESSITETCSDVTSAGIALVRNNVRSVAITASLTLIFSFSILFIFIYNNSKVVKDTIDKYDIMSMGSDDNVNLKTVGVADLK